MGTARGSTGGLEGERTAAGERVADGAVLSATHGAGGRWDAGSHQVAVAAPHEEEGRLAELRACGASQPRRSCSSDSTYAEKTALLQRSPGLRRTSTAPSGWLAGGRLGVSLVS